MGENKPVVKYHNDLNSITFYSFGAIDFNLFMSICNKMMEKGKSEIEIPFDELRRLSGFNSHWSEEQFIKSMDSMNLKQLLSHGRIDDGRYIKRFVLFPELWIDKEKRVLIVKANENYLYILNELKKNFTRFELQEFVSLDSKYSKTLYRLLKQFRTTGVYVTTLEEFKRLMGVPKSYTNMRIHDKIIKPSMKALKPYFNNLSCEVLYKPERGRPVKGYKFTFKPEKRQEKLPEKPEGHKNQGANSFHNFEQRKYDYEDLERRLTERNIDA